MASSNSVVVCSPGGFDIQAALQSIVEEYCDEAEDAMYDAVDAGARATKGDLAKSPHKVSGDYNRGWRIERKGRGSGRVVMVVRNKKRYMLSHLVEKGHGGPHPAPAHPHIEPAAKHGSETVLKRLGVGR